jgi:hypothetical protein
MDVLYFDFSMNTYRRFGLGFVACPFLNEQNFTPQLEHLSS